MIRRPEVYTRDKRWLQTDTNDSLRMNRATQPLNALLQTVPVSNDSKRHMNNRHVVFEPTKQDDQFAPFLTVGQVELVLVYEFN